MYSPVLLWSKELSVFKGHLGPWFEFIPTKTGVQLSKAPGFALETGTEGKQKRGLDTITLFIFGDFTNSQCLKDVLTGALLPMSF